MTALNPSRQTVEIICAFCGGQGRDPFGVMSPLATCSVCSGVGRHTLFLPTASCAFCQGSGVYPHSRLTCTSCGGLGMVHVPPGAIACPACGGTGRAADYLWTDSPLSCGYCRGIGLVSEVRVTLFSSSSSSTAGRSEPDKLNTPV